MIKKSKPKFISAYCVIGDKSSNVSFNIERTWFPSADKAAEHAGKLLDKQTRQHYSKPPTRLFVVKVELIVTLKGPVPLPYEAKQPTEDDNIGDYEQLPVTQRY